MDILYIIIPAYNEEDNIKKTIDEWYPKVCLNSLNDESRLIIINDGSTDNTAAIVEKERKKKDRLILLNKKNGGHGSSILCGYQYAVDSGADFIFQTDSDGQTVADEFDTFWDKRNNYQAIFGKRTKRGDGKVRAFIEKVLCFILRIIFGVNIPDANAPFRLYKKEYLSKYIEILPKDYFLPNVILTMMGILCREKVLFVNITFNNRGGGTGSIHIWEIVKIGYKSVIGFVRLKKKVQRNWIQKQNKVDESILQQIGIYTMFFIINILIAFSFIFFRGKSLIWRDDCVADFFIKCAYRKTVFRETVSNFFSGNGLLIPFVNFNLTGDSNLTKFVGYEIFDVIFWIIPKAYFEIAFCIVQILRIWLAGLSFFVFSTKLKNDWKYSIIGSVIYVFCAYSINAAITQPIFLSLLYYFPMILLGVEMQIREKKRWILVLFCTLSFLCNVYLMYYCSCVLAIFCLFRIIFLDVSMREKIRTSLSLMADYFLGFSFSAFLTVPIIVEILASSRIGNDSYQGSNWLYNGIAQFKGIASFFAWETPAYGSWSYYGFLAVSFIPLLYILISKEARTIKWTLIAILICMNMPLFGKIFGLSTINNRWSYCLAFAVSYAVVTAVPKIVYHLSSKEKICINLLAAIFCGFSVYIFLVEKTRVLFINSLVLISITILVNLLWRHKVSENILFVCVMLISTILILFNSALWFTQKRVSGFIEKGDVISQLESYIDVAAEEIEDSGFWRMDKNDCIDELSCNLSYWFGYDGISSFSNMINPYALEYYRISENTGIMQANKTSDLDRRITDELLANVKYFASTKENTIVPYGFNKINETETYQLYETSWALPIAYIYSETISYEEFQVMNVAEKQEILLKAIVLEDGEGSQSIELKSCEIIYEIDEVVGIEREDVLWQVINENNSILIRANIPQNSEIYLEIEGSHKAGKGICYVNVTEDTGRQNNAAIQGSEVERATHQTNIAINLGAGISAGEHEFLVSFSGSANVSFDEIHMYARPLSEIRNDTDSLKESNVSDIQITTNRVEMNIDLSENGWLCFSIPYSPGWQCYVDEDRILIERANVMYMAVQLDKGEHDIELKYFPYGMRTGIAISVGSILICIGLFAVRKK